MPTVNFYLEQPYFEGKNPEERKSIQETIKLLKKEKKSIPVGLLNPNETTIYLIVREGKKKPIKVKTGRRILSKYWSGQKDTPVKGGYTGSPELNQYLRNLKNDTFSLINEKTKGKHAISFEQLGKEVEKLVLKLPEKKSNINLLILFQWFIEGDLNLGIEPNPKGLGDASLNKYKRVRELVIEFSTKHKQSLELLDINYAWWAKFKNYILSTGNFLNQSANKQLDKLKSLLNHTIKSYSEEMGGYVDEEICQKLAANLKRFDKFEFSEKDRARPEEQEMEFLRTLNLTMETRLEKVRDVFVFTAWSGPRCSNLKDLKPFHADLEGSTLRYKAIKTKDQADTEVPLNEIASGIILKYWGKQPTLLPALSGQKANEYFVEILQVLAEFNEIATTGKDLNNQEMTLEGWPNYSRFCTWVGGEAKIPDPDEFANLIKLTAGFNKTIEIKERRGRVIETTYVKRYTLLTLHSMRHFYGTFLVNEGLSLEDVGALMAITPATAKIYSKTKNQKAAEKARAVLNKPIMKIA